MDINKNLHNDLDDLKDIIHLKKCTGYFICFTLEDSAGFTRYCSSDYLVLLGMVSLMTDDMKLAMLEALDEIKEQSADILETRLKNNVRKT